MESEVLNQVSSGTGEIMSCFSMEGVKCISNIRISLFVQCLRRWRDEGDKMQLFNAGKYASAMVAVAMKVTYQSKHNTTWLVLFIVFSCFAAIYQLYWDIVIDWGLLQRKSKNPWLRDSLILKKKYRYFLSMVGIQHARINYILSKTRMILTVLIVSLPQMHQCLKTLFLYTEHLQINH